MPRCVSGPTRCSLPPRKMSIWTRPVASTLTTLSLGLKVSGNNNLREMIMKHLQLWAWLRISKSYKTLHVTKDWVTSEINWIWQAEITLSTKLKSEEKKRTCKEKMKIWALLHELIKPTSILLPPDFHPTEKIRMTNLTPTKTTHALKFSLTWDIDRDNCKVVESTLNSFDNP